MGKNSTHATGTPGFTLVEILLSIMLMGIILTTAYSAFQTIIVQQGQIDAQVDINRDVYYYTEKFFDLIQSSGNLDYEEYWNRRVLGYKQDFDTNRVFAFQAVSVYGNGSEYSSDTGKITNLISCISSDCTHEPDPRTCIVYTRDFPSDNCFSAGAFNTSNKEISGPQIYGQYSELFFDRNKDANWDRGDEDGDKSARGDLDDRDMGIGPAVIGGDRDNNLMNPIDDGLPELYLYQEGKDGTSRTFFRYILRDDPEYIADHPSVTGCNPGTHVGCLGTIQILKLIGSDRNNDGQTDTWSQHGDFQSIDDWVDLFPPYIDVVDARFFITPTRNPAYAWNTPDVPQKNSTNVQASVRIRLAVELSYGRQKRAHRRKDVFQTRNSFTSTINLGTLGHIENK